MNKIPSPDVEASRDDPGGDQATGRLDYQVTEPRPTSRFVLRRSVHDRQVAGVAGGLAHRFGLPSSLVRGAIVGLALAGLGRLPWPIPVAYLIAWLVLPVGDQRPLVFRLRHRAALQEAGAAVLAMVVTVGALSGDAVWVTVMLALAGLLLLDVWSEPGTEPPEPRPTDPAPSTTSAGAPIVGAAERARRWGRNFRAGRAGAAEIADADKHAGPPDESNPIGRSVDRLTSGELLRSRPRRQRRRPSLWPLTLSALAVWSVAMFSLDRLIEPGVDPGVIVNGAVVIVGAVIALGAWRGRPGLITWLLLVPLGLAWAAVTPDRVVRYADDGEQYHALDDVVPGETYRFTGGYGLLSIDAGGIDLAPGEEITVEIAQTGGEVELLYPASVQLVGDADVSFGSLMATDHSWAEGFVPHQQLYVGACVPEETDRFADETDRFAESVCDDDAPVLRLDLDAGLSTVRIRPIHQEQP